MHRLAIYLEVRRGPPADLSGRDRRTLLKEQTGMIKTIRSQKGQTIVEFAFMLPLLMIIVVGIIDFSIIFYNKAVVTNASREGARAGCVARYDPSINPSPYVPLDLTGVQTAVNNYLAGRVVTFGAPNITTSVTWGTSPTPPLPNASPPGTPAAPPASNYIDVVVTYRYTFLALARFAGWGSTMNISAETIMRME